MKISLDEPVEDIDKRLVNKLLSKKSRALDHEVTSLLINVKSGWVMYTVSSRVAYDANFAISENPFRLLLYLSGRIGQTFYPGELIKTLKPPRKGYEHASPERRIRDTIQQIRKKLELTNREDSFFIIEKTPNGSKFGINCVSMNHQKL